MKESTKKIMDAASELVTEAGMKMDPAGFKYHSERTWLGFTECGKVIAEEEKEGQGVSSKTAFWIICKRKIHDCFEEVSRHSTFDAAMEHLKSVDGVWSAFWTLNQIFKGDHMLICVEIEGQKTNAG